jgi:hypothetical protein
MAIKRLSEKDIDELLLQYRSERRRLSYQLDTIREAIGELKALREGKQGPSNGEAPVKRGPGRPRKNPADHVAPRKKPGRRKKRVIKDGGYRLSNWDQMVVDAIEKRAQLLPKSEILKAATTWARKNEPGMSPEEVEAKITRVLQKLSGKRGVLGAHRSGLRRGYHYGIKDWFFSSSGLLRKQHYDKLVLTDD